MSTIAVMCADTAGTATGARTGWPWVSQDADRDVVLTGDGDDSVTSGVAGQLNPDVVDLGSGDDGLSWISSGWVDGSSITGGGSENQGDHIGLELQAGANTLDTALPDGTGELSRGPVQVARWGGMEQHYVHDRSATEPASVTLTGGDANDRVSVSGAVALVADLGAGNDSLSLWRALPGDATVEADLGAGNDYLAVSQPPPAGTRLRAGAGRDSLTMGSDSMSLSWDLAGDGIHVGTDRVIEADSFEDATLMAPRVELWGTSDDNTLAFVSCDATLRGRGGDDTLRMTSDYEFEHFKTCRDASVMVGGAGDDNFTSQGETRDRLVGGRGNDRFNAKGGNDILLGGPGRDIADAGSGRDRFQGGPGRDRVDGGKGRDTCSAERQQRCER